MIDQIGLDVSRETIDDLQAFAVLTEKWTAKINLIAKSTIPDIWTRHIIDSAQVYQYADAPNHWVDIGSGGGFPGIVMAILSKQYSSATTFTLIESDARKCTFLRTVARELNLNVYVITQRIEETENQIADVVSARALGGMPDLLPLVTHHLKPDGQALLMKGQAFAGELDAVRDNWDFDLVEYPSITNPDSRILSLKRITRAA